MNLTELQPVTRHAITLRSVLIGLAVVVLIAGFTPYNDYILDNTPVIGSALPTGVILLLMFLVLPVNGVLRWWRAGSELRTGELAVVLAMALVACSVPAGGFMRYFVGLLIGVNHVTGSDDRYRDLLSAMRLPDWLFPTFTTPIERRANDRVIRDFVGRVPPQGSFWAFWKHVHWGAWVTPAVTWGVFYSLMVAAVLAMMVLVRRQWAENERLPFPLASIYLSIIEAPEPGRAVNRTLGSKLFWIAAGGVFAVQLLKGFHTYYPRYIPEFPTGYDLNSILADGWTRNFQGDFKKASLYFAVIGITFFLSQKVAFSLWVFMVLTQVVRAGYGNYELEYSDAMQKDQLFGALLPYTLAMLYVGRHHFGQVLGMMFGKREDRTRGGYLPEGVAGWVLIGSVVGMVGWLVWAGVSVWAGVCFVLSILMLFLVVARVVAETGMPYVGLYLNLSMPMSLMMQMLPASMAAKFATRDVFMGQVLYGLFSHDHRESLPHFALHSMKVADESLVGGERNERAGLLRLMAVCIALAFVASLASWLVIEHKYATVATAKASDIPNVWATTLMPKYVIYETALTYQDATSDSPQSYSHTGHVLFGAGLMSVLSYFRLRYEAFPLHPVGYLLCGTLGLQWTWFSILLGWLAKSVTLRLGGSALYRRVVPLFVGLIVGEAMAAAFFLFFTLARLGLGLEILKVKLLEG
jgi:hypothetical protein